MSERLRIFTEHLPSRKRMPAPTSSTGAPTLKLVMPFEQRQKARQRARITAGFEVGIQLPRGTVLRGGDQLRAADGTLLDIVAAREPVSTVWSRDLRRLAQVAYHLGNRHVALEIGTGWVRYLADHVLDAMVEQLGLAVIHHDEPFEPEAGAYGHEHDGAPHGHLHREGFPHDHGEQHGHRVIFGGLHRHSHDDKP
jgi:urease accessory protein